VPVLSRLAAVALSLAVAFALALTQTAQVVFTYDGDSTRSVSFAAVLARSLPAWLLLGLLAPPAAMVCRRWRLEPRPAAIARHAAVSLIFAGAHIVLLAAIKAGQAPAVAFADAVRSAIFYNLVGDVLIYWAIAGIVQALGDARRLRRHAADALVLEASLTEARLDALRAQLEPHFIYNVLNTAAMAAREQRGEETVAMLARLGELLRHVLREGNGVTTLGDEVEFLRRYLELERLRFADRLEVEIAIDPSLLEIQVPSLLLQPLVENAIRHGIARRPGAGRISIRARRRDERVEIEVRDDGVGLDADPEPAGDGIGLANTRDRLTQRYGGEARLELEPVAGGGACARITIPRAEAAA
jgi:two-component system, LytTR family, sensor kinase